MKDVMRTEAEQASEAPGDLTMNIIKSKGKKKKQQPNDSNGSPQPASEVPRDLEAVGGESEKKKKKSKRHYDDVVAEESVNDKPESESKKRKRAVSDDVSVANGENNGTGKKNKNINGANESETGKKNKNEVTGNSVKSAESSSPMTSNGVEGNEKTKKNKKSKSDNGEQNGCAGVVEKSATVSDDPGDFAKFRISPILVSKLQEKGIRCLFPVQYKSFNIIYDDFDCIVQSRTGSGKTLTFAIPLVERLNQLFKTDQSRKPYGNPPKVLVMAPTRELAKQVADTFTDISDPAKLTVLSVYGGTQIYPQERSLRGGVDVLVGTPGRIQDLINRGSLDLTQLKHVVLDEVDRMLDMGFADDVDKILQQRYSEGGIDSNPQTLLFSATLPDWIHQTAKKYLRPTRKHIDLIGNESVRTSKTVRHLAIRCHYFDRPTVINSVLQAYSGALGRSIVFCETKKEADELSLSAEIKQETQVIHGDIPQEKREKVLKGFRDGRHRCLIATDVAARGLDIPEIDLVIQCCPPKDVESYIHRAGRTGRAGREGVCVLFYKPNEEYEVTSVERRAGITFERIGAPSPRDLIRTSAQDAVRNVEQVNEKTVSHFREFAEDLLIRKIKGGMEGGVKVKGEGLDGLSSAAVDIVAAALALISGNGEVKQRSLINCKEGFTTFLYRAQIEMNVLGYAWRALERCFTPEIKEKILRMRFCADRKGCVFDLPSDVADEALGLWYSGMGDTLEIPDDLPALQEVEFSSGGGGYQRGRGFGRGGFGRNSSFRGGNGGRGGNRGGGARYDRRSY